MRYVPKNPTKNAAATAEAKNAASLKGCLKECMVYEAKVSTENNLKNYVMVNVKENLNPVFTTTRNHFEIEVIKSSFQSTFGN